MPRKTIDASTVRRIAAEVDCDSKTVRNVFATKTAPTAASRRVLSVLLREKLLDESEVREYVRGGRKAS